MDAAHIRVVMVAAVGVKGLLECAQAGAAAKLGVEQTEQQVLAAEAFAVFVGFVCADMAGEASVHNGLDDLLKAACVVHGCSSDVFELTLWGLPVKTLGCNLFVWVAGFYSGQ